MAIDRRTLLKLAAGMALVRDALAAGDLERGVYRVRGDARINGQPARRGQEVRAGDTVNTGADGELVFVISRDAMLVRANSRVEVTGAAGAAVADGLRIVTGAVLSVFASGQAKRIQTATATIGIRGTAGYVDAMADRTYVCICYGRADLASVADPQARETVQTRHHDQPRYIMGSGAPQMIMGAPVVNHTDAELIFLEGLTGRRPPFLDQPDYQPGKY